MEQQKDEITKEKIIGFASHVAHDNKVIQDKINYFIDCVQLLGYAAPFPFSIVNTDARLLANGLEQLIQSSSKYKLKYATEYYENYGSVLNPEGILNENYRVLLLEIKNQFDSLSAAKPWNNRQAAIYDPTNLVLNVQNLCDELNSNFIENMIHRLKQAVFCPGTLIEHDYIKIIEACAEVIIVEFTAIGYPPEEVLKVFEKAIGSHLINFDFNRLPKGDVYAIPVPPAIRSLRDTIPFEEYKAKAREHAKQNSLDIQFNNLFYIFQQAQRSRKFIFKIKDLIIDSEDKFEYNGVTFSKSFSEKYLKEDQHERFSSFFMAEEGVTFCEVVISSGSTPSGLRLASKKVRECLNYLHYYAVSDNRAGIESSRLDLSDYVLFDLDSLLFQQSNIVYVKPHDLDFFKGYSDLENLRNYPTVAEFLRLDKIFFNATAEKDNFAVGSELWRFCESLFKDDKKEDKIIAKLVSYYSKKADFHIYRGLHHIIDQYNHRMLFYPDKYIQDSLGITYDELRFKMVSDTNGEPYESKEYIRVFNKMINHPLINARKEKLFSLQTGFDKILKDHYKKIITSGYIQRNMFQHSNITIDELNSIESRAFRIVVGTLRRFIIDDLKERPDIGSIEELFD